MKYDFVLRSNRVLLPDGERPASVCVCDGRIATIEPYEFGGDDLGDRALLPGLVDTHVHVNEPGRTDIPLFAGWNMVGYPAQNDSTYRVSQLMLDTGAVEVLGYDPGSPYRISSLAGGYVMKRGEAYLVRVNADTIWTVNW